MIRSAKGRFLICALCCLLPLGAWTHEGETLLSDYWDYGRFSLLVWLHRENRQAPETPQQRRLIENIEHMLLNHRRSACDAVMDEHGDEFLMLGMFSSTAQKIQRMGVDEFAAETAEMFPDVQFGEREKRRMSAVSEMITGVEFACSGGEAAEKALERKMQDYISRAFGEKE